MKVVIDRITERAAEASQVTTEASKQKSSHGVAPSKNLSAEEGAAASGTGGDNTAGYFADTPATHFAKGMPLLPLKLESRACGALAAWVRDTVVLVDALTRGEEM